MPSNRPTKGPDMRQAPRIPLPAPYTVLKARPSGDQRYRWTGFIYDISTSGMRFEVDERIEDQTALEVHITLPRRGNTRPTTIQATGRVVRMHDDEPGPVRMGLHFEAFRSESDRKRLAGYVGRGNG